jgi:hypothetical protein
LKIPLLESATELKATGRDLWESSEHGRWSIKNRQCRDRRDRPETEVWQTMMVRLTSLYHQKGTELRCD